MYILCTHAADCGPVSSPSSGYVSPYSSTLEGATVTFTFMCENIYGQTFSLDGTTVCNSEGDWVPNQANICGKSSSINSEAFLMCIIIIEGPLFIINIFQDIQIPLRSWVTIVEHLLPLPHQFLCLSSVQQNLPSLDLLVGTAPVNSVINTLQVER